VETRSKEAFIFEFSRLARALCALEVLKSKFFGVNLQIHLSPEKLKVERRRLTIELRVERSQSRGGDRNLVD
jgi:hypothetical protein